MLEESIIYNLHAHKSWLIVIKGRYGIKIARQKYPVYITKVKSSSST